MSPRSVHVVRASSLFPLSVVLTVVGLACSSSSSTAVVDGGPGIVSGEADNHCMGVDPIVVNQASCDVTDVPDAGAGSDDGGASDGGTGELPVHFGSSSDDDDCKYHASFTTTPVLVNATVTFNVTVTKLADNSPATKANVALEAYLADDPFTLIANGTKTTETPAGSGKYVLTPIKFGKSGRWVVRFHFYEMCADILDDSPHGHVAFYYDVP